MSLLGATLTHFSSLWESLSYNFFSHSQALTKSHVFRKQKFWNNLNSQISIQYPILNFSPTPWSRRLLAGVGWCLPQNSFSSFFCFPSPPLQAASVFFKVTAAGRRGARAKKGLVDWCSWVQEGKPGCLNASSLSPAVLAWFLGWPLTGDLQRLPSGTNDSPLCSSFLTLTRPPGSPFPYRCSLLGLLHPAACSSGRIPDNPRLAPFKVHTGSMGDLHTPSRCPTLNVRDVTNTAVLIYSAKGQPVKQPVPLDFPRHD